MKTKSSAKKRFSFTGSGKRKKIRRNSAYMRHLLTKKSKKRKGKLGNSTLVHPSDEKNIREQLCG